MKNRSIFGWLELTEGILLILLGCYTFIRPGSAFAGLMLLYGLMAVIMGIADIVLYIRMERYTGFGPVLSLITGTLSVMVGFSLLISPAAGRIVLTVLFPLWFIAHCISKLLKLNDIRLFSGAFTYYFTMILNIAGLILGTMMLIDPWFSLISIRYIVSLYLVLLGIDCVIMAVSSLGKRS